MKNTFFPKEFIEKYSTFLGNEWDDFFKCIQKKQPKSFWVNSNKTNIFDVQKNLKTQNIKITQHKFDQQAFQIEYTKPGDLEYFKQGKISLQEKASMLPVIALSPKKTDYVLDACAAPGMKTIQLSNFAGKVLATDVNSKRIQFLKFTKNKYDLENVTIYREDVRNLKEKFDKIILDAPCSSEGLVRKQKDALKEWSQKLVIKKSKIQKTLIEHCYNLLKKNGELIYSTCSFAPEENEEVVNYLLSKTNAFVEKVFLEGIKIRKNALCKNCVRLYPQDNNTQQFFFAKIKKP
jgi:tRNA (cytosine49-C5)-methyltransferase